jgi:hypothetical protein
MRLSLDQARDGSLEAHARPTAGLALHLQFSAELEGPVAHRLLAHPDPWALGVEPAAVVGHLHAGEVALAPQPYPGVPGLRVASDVGERLLDDAREFPALSDNARGNPSSTISSSS